MTHAIYTVGHSTHPIDGFIDILDSYDIELLADVRTIPASRRNPQFSQSVLKKSLEAAGIGYVHIKELGGLRHARKDSANTGWKNASFRGYADYMETPEFEKALDNLITIAKKSRTVIMCAEAVPWRCHRSLVGDALLARGVGVIDIFSADKSEAHKLTSFAVTQGNKVTYPGAQGSLL